MNAFESSPNDPIAAVSSDEASSSESEQIPYRKKEDTVAGGDQEDEEEDVDDEDGDPDEYNETKIKFNYKLLMPLTDMSLKKYALINSMLR